MHPTTPTAPSILSTNPAAWPTLSRLEYFDEEFRHDEALAGWRIMYSPPKWPAQYPCRMAASNYMICHVHHGKTVWRRVYITCISNSGAFFVKVGKKVYALHDWMIPGYD